jgi:ABC-2 type transport system ATP-binding protein
LNRAPTRLDTPPARAAGAAPAEVPDHGYPLAIRDVHKRWAKNQPPVLDGVDLELDLGTKTWVGGRNGAGKTTLMRIAAGLIDPDRGRVQAWGFGPRERRSQYHRLVAFLPAGDRGLYARLSVRQQLRFWAGMAMLEPKQGARRVEEMLDSFELRELAERRVDRLSMGQRQRVRIAMTWLGEPETVLLDEPLTSLDGEGALLLERAIEELLARGGALLWCSPSGDHPALEFDSDWILDQGKLVRQ